MHRHAEITIALQTHTQLPFHKTTKSPAHARTSKSLHLRGQQIDGVLTCGDMLL